MPWRRIEVCTPSSTLSPTRNGTYVDGAIPIFLMSAVETVAIYSSLAWNVRETLDVCAVYFAPFIGTLTSWLFCNYMNIPYCMHKCYMGTFSAHQCAFYLSYDTEMNVDLCTGTVLMRRIWNWLSPLFSFHHALKAESVLYKLFS